ncbi:tRNA (guanosine(37)-N1)-methyltransferase TrmD [Acetobacterium tundrae]|uniref:tRNA (guanine-N(1)-)-methyltransferase n=1 Tax=Acetobacterium tundrae TaxID=132932 RepID=A0ABR6WJ97_9FIRM|nr:tRNA (guanosine(37)-N1)-methyltransferase TrmD [Acetobacterium tundrae]MBC3796559.1 tRNA (guanosine(37)-N1)-methyltransferase TrmD [Acetobacterium tundrae]
MRYYFLTLFPEIFHTYFQTGMIDRGVKAGIIEYEVINIRDFSGNKHNKVDDSPYGGGAGMVMAAPPIAAALKSIPNFSDYPVIYLTPGGKPFEQKDGISLSQLKGIVFICGHYEGIDQRVIDHYVTREYSVGDYVLTGGELPALTVADAIARHIPGFLGNCDSLCEESFESNLLEYPQYTKPREFEGLEVPEVLLSGHHEAVGKWRQAKSEEKTQINRPDLYEKYKKNLPNE